MVEINPSEITPEHIFHSRRKFLVSAGAFVVSAMFLGSCSKQDPLPPIASGFCDSAQASKTADEFGDALTSCESIVN